MGKKLLFVLNPFSGKAQIKHNLLKIIDTFVKAGWEVTVHPTQERLDAYETIRTRAHDYQMVVVSGGDGTLNEGVRGLMEIKKEMRPDLGYIPAGTVNDFASSFNIPKNMAEAAKNIVEGAPLSCDVGKFGDEYFTYVAAFGAFTDVPYETSQQFKNLFGYAAYVMEGIKRLASIRSCHVTAEYDGNTVEGDFIFGMVSNTTYVAGMKYNPDFEISLNDGLFEVVLIKMPSNPIEFQLTITELLRQDVSSAHFVAFKTANIRFWSEEAITWTLDGEFGGAHQEIEIQNKQNAVRFITRGFAQDGELE